ncbi:MAG TPA: MarR family transcriptional regulator [Propionicimonas sp.]|uniref:MarR family winged helix-turn-helix transcriptional regulator n=1 Tax=Propionicimonas sp. TaxID=1955623 RepID=UPI002F40CA98
MTLPALANDLRIACQRVSRRVRFESTDELAPHLVSALSHLKKGAHTPGELADLERVAPPSMTRTINCLVEKGLVTRDDNPSDGRSKLLVLTDAGQATMDRIGQARDDWMLHQLEGLTKPEQDLLRQAAVLLNQVVGR